MRIIDSHFHWWPRSVFEQTLQRSTYPRVERNANGGFDLCRNPGVTGIAAERGMVRPRRTARPHGRARA
jgi:hypothetical protein